MKADELTKHMAEPLVSVVLVVCNVERFLAEAIESVLGQTFLDFEFIIVDFGSTDNSKSIISDFAVKDNRIKFHTIPHCGLAEARNVGCFMARGRYIAIMDADDVCVPDRLRLEINFMEEHPQVGLLGGATDWIDANGRFLRVHSYPTEDQEIRSQLSSLCPFCQPSVLLRSEAFTIVGGYRAAFAPAEDYDLWIRISERFQCANLAQVVLKYRIHPYQVSMRKKTQQTLCLLAAQASADFRRSGSPDPLNLVEEITPATLASVGVPESTQQIGLSREYWWWINHICMADEHAAALSAAVEMLQSSDWEFAERPLIANLHVTAARLHWRQKDFPRSFLAAWHALMIQPTLVRRFLEALLRRLRLVA